MHFSYSPFPGGHEREETRYRVLGSRRRSIGRLGATFVLLVSVFAFIYLLSRCIALNKEKQLHVPAGRRLAGQKGRKAREKEKTDSEGEGAGDGVSIVQDLCGEETEETQQKTPEVRPRRPRKQYLGPGSILLWDDREGIETGGEEVAEELTSSGNDKDDVPPSKRTRQEESTDEEEEASPPLTPPFVAGDYGSAAVATEAVAPTEAAAPTAATEEDTAEGLPQDILKYVEDVLAEDDGNIEREEELQYARWVELLTGIQDTQPIQERNTETIKEKEAKGRKRKRREEKGAEGRYVRQIGFFGAFGPRFLHRPLLSDDGAEVGTKAGKEKENGEASTPVADPGGEGPSTGIISAAPRGRLQQKRSKRTEGGFLASVAAAAPFDPRYQPQGTVLVNPIGYPEEEEEQEQQQEKEERGEEAKKERTRRHTSRQLEYTVRVPFVDASYVVGSKEITDESGQRALLVVSVPLPSPEEQRQLQQQQLQQPQLQQDVHLQPQPDLLTYNVNHHPFYRRPLVASDAVLSRQFERRHWSTSRRTLIETGALIVIKNILKKPILSSRDLKRLLECLEQLVEHTLHRKKEVIEDLGPKYVVEKLAIALVLTDAMFVAAEVLGENAKRDEWWEATLDTLPVYTRPSQSSVGRRTAEQNVLLARLLQNGLEFYKRGLRPPSGYLVPVKQIIFSTPALPALQRSPWAHFRADDEEWQQQQQLLLHLQDRLPASEPLQEEEQREEQQQQQKRQEEQQQQQLQHEEQQKQQQQHEDQQLQDQQQEEQQQQQLQ